MNLQPTLANELVQIIPLKEADFDELFAIASDELLWEQHPEKDRYKKEVFLKLFQEAIQSGTAFKVIDVKTGNTIGSTRYYEYNEKEKSVAIGYTYIDRKYWATPYNRALKNLMINYAFQFVERIIFHVGDTNFRSQKAVEKLGAILSETFLNKETGKTHFTFSLTKENWK
ncbi:GNAT family N-acetyltransferase [Flavobacterium terrigena]|uniref:N-acetyltransferase domain-containing protein n=1 Tax=Flavobacterium terrigena TaxID=402734 RepID=A0A1H6S7B8_9FLAO|nr:GNAT family N-acetyltransferase [Flavobacterium terrigena]SEI59332.1 hypothetical protein SAMN05660918_1061 [Flavobacterium terrigena]